MSGLAVGSMFGALSCSLNRSLIRSQRRNYIVLCLMTFTCICIRPTRWNNIACPMMSQDGADMHNMSFKCMQNKWRQLAQKCTSSIRLSKFLSAKGQTCNLPRVMHALPSTTQLGASLTYTDTSPAVLFACSSVGCNHLPACRQSRFCPMGFW